MKKRKYFIFLYIMDYFLFIFCNLIFEGIILKVFFIVYDILRLNLFLLNNYDSCDCIIDIFIGLMLVSLV